MFDDVGFADFGCFGSSIRTPNIDGLAADGLRYNNFHTTALCSPTRACLLTGRNHHSVGMGVVSNWDTGFPGYRGRVSKRAGTMAEMLRSAGYATMAVGKWHLAPIEETTAAGPYDQWPLQSRVQPLLRLPGRRHRPVGARPRVRQPPCRPPATGRATT